MARIEYDINWVKYLLVDALEKNYLEREYGIFFISVEPFLRRKEILYIGKVVNQTFPEKIRQHYQTINESYKNRIQEVTVFVACGKFNNIDPNERIVNEVENLLIYNQKPVHNNQLKDKYYGRAIAIKNVGAYAPLKKEYDSPLQMD